MEKIDLSEVRAQSEKLYRTSVKSVIKADPANIEFTEVLYNGCAAATVYGDGKDRLTVWFSVAGLPRCYVKGCFVDKEKAGEYALRLREMWTEWKASSAPREDMP